MEKESRLEKVAGSLPTELAGTLIAALSGNPVGALLPVLTNALATGRHRERLARTLSAMSSDLNALKDRLDEIDDGQYKLLNEAILAAFQTIDEKKLEYLRRVARNAVEAEGIEPQEAALLARLVRDLSADEVEFLINHRDKSRIHLSKTQPDEAKTFLVNPDSADGLIVTGLVGLGLLVPAEPTWSENNLFQFAPVVPILISLLRESGSDDEG